MNIYQENIVRYLVEHGADINKENNVGQTSLHFYSENGNEYVVFDQDKLAKKVLGHMKKNNYF